MDFKTKSKFLLVLGIIFVAFLLFNTNSVNATEISDYKCKIEKDGYIVYNNYFNTSDVKVTIENSYENFPVITVSKVNIDVTTYKNFISNNNNKVLVKVDSNVTSAKLDGKTENLSIVELNNQKYAVIDVTLEDIFGDGTESEQYESYNDYVIEITKNDTTETKKFGLSYVLDSADYFHCTINVVSSTGKIYESAVNKNGIINGMGMHPLPAKIDFSNSYVEYLANQYMGESIKIDCLGTVPYVGKYGDNYKYKANLKNVKLDTGDGQNLTKFSFKNSQSCGGFYLDESYTIDNETYVEKNGTNSDTKLKYDLQGKFTGTLKVEEISKNDIIYNKVQEKLNKSSSNDIYMTISNVYIENGSYEGKLKLTFNVGEEYNGKNYNVVHMKSENYDFEEFTGIVENGKIEITVDSLSPFGISIFEKETAQEETQTTEENTNATTNKGEKDVTPKTGTVDIIGYVLLGTVLSGVGIVALKKKF